MKIGFIQPDEDDSSEAVLGYAEAAANEGNGDGGWLEWWYRVLLDFSLVYGILAIVEDFINYIME